VRGKRGEAGKRVELSVCQKNELTENAGRIWCGWRRTVVGRTVSREAGRGRIRRPHRASEKKGTKAKQGDWWGGCDHGRSGTVAGGKRLSDWAVNPKTCRRVGVIGGN